MKELSDTELLDMIADVGLYSDEGTKLREEFKRRGYTDKKFNDMLLIIGSISSIRKVTKYPPKGGYFSAFKRRFFRPKTNWNRLATLAAIAGLIIILLIFFLE